MADPVDQTGQRPVIDTRLTVRRSRRAVAFATAALLLAGCAEVPPDAGFDEAAQAIKDRTGVAPTWNRSGSVDPAVTARVHALLVKPLSVDTAVEIGLINSPELQAAFEDIGIAQGDLVQAGLLKNPSLDLALLAATPQTLYSGIVTEDFVSVFTRAARQRIAGKELETASYLVAAKAVDDAAEIRQAYYTVVADQQVLAFYRQLTSSTMAAATLSERQLQAGNVSVRDQAVQQQTYATALLEETSAETMLAGDREMLNQRLGLWGDETNWTVPDRLADVPEATLDTANLESMAVANRLDLAAAKRNVELAADTLGLTQDYWFLQGLGLGFDYERDSDNAHKKGPVLNLTLPVFDLGQGRIRSGEAALRQQERRYEALAIELRSKVRLAAVKLMSAQRMALYYEKTVLPLQANIMSQSQPYYNGMLLGPFDLLLIRQNQIETRRDAIASMREYWIERSELDRLTGTRSGPTQSSETPMETKVSP